MPPNVSDPSSASAVEALLDFGLSTYAARTFVALVALGQGTAREVSEASDVPRTRVYDAAEELADRGLVEVHRSSPRRFRAVSAQTAGRTLRHEYARRAEALTEALGEVGPSASATQQRGVWTVTGRDAVEDRVVEFLRSADAEVVFMTVGDLLTDDVRDAVRAASDRGAAVKLAGMADPVVADLAAELPRAEWFESVWSWSDTPAGRVLMVDREKTLVSVLLEGDGDNPPEPRDETAIWGTGRSNSLVVVLEATFAWQLDGERD